MTESEIWKDVVGYEGRYQVSNKGNVYSVGRIDVLGRKQGGLMLTLRLSIHGYPIADLYKNGKLKTKSVHRLVAETFLPNPNGLPQVNHRDEDKDNNNVENLEWCDSKYNINYGTRSERSAQTRSKKVRAVNTKTGEVLTFNSAKEAEKEGYYNVSAPCRGIYCTSGHLYKGHKWSYEEEPNK